MNFSKIYLLRFLAQRFEREKTSWCWDSCQLTRFLSPAPFFASPSPPLTLSWILRLIWNHKQGPCSSPCLGKIIGMTFLCRNVPGFCQQIFALLFLVSTNSFFHENLYFRILTRPCFTRVGIPLASNPDLLSFCTQYANDFANPANPVFIPVFLFFNKQWWGGGGGRGVKCEKVESMFNQELTPIGPRPNLILSDPLHCYKKFIHAAGDHHWPRKNIRLVRTVKLRISQPNRFLFE